ncbi:hypothetical protein ACP4OV_002351 [Aristida adscensionis]
MDVDMWISLPPDLLLEIFRRLEFTPVVRCAAACKPRRRAIVGNAASSLRPRPDRFLPDLLLGFLCNNGEGNVRLRPLESLLAAQPSGAGAADDGDSARCCDGEAASFCVPPAAAAAPPPASTSINTVDDLCLWSTMAGGGCTFLPAAAFEDCRYLLATAYDLSTSDDDDTAARTIAVELDGHTDIKNGTCLTYQLFSPTSGGGSGGGGGGAWGPIKRSADRVFPGTGAICRGAVYWLGIARMPKEKCTFAVDVVTGRTWTTALPEKLRRVDFFTALTRIVLATSSDGRLSIVSFDPPCHRMQAWVLTGGDWWTLRWTVDVANLPGHGPNYWSPFLYAFCPRSGHVIGNLLYGLTLRICDIGSVTERALTLLIDVDSGAAREMNMCTRHGPNWPFEMDLPTYISKMKHF